MKLSDQIELQCTKSYRYPADYIVPITDSLVKIICKNIQPYLEKYSDLYLIYQQLK